MMLHSNPRQLFFTFLIICFSMFIVSCGSTMFDKEKYGNCSDEVQNQNEEGVDCGGHCLPCADCIDGEKNAGETGIDCGGSCVPCALECATPSSTAEYSLHPQSSSSVLIDESSTNYSFYNQNTSTIRIDFNSGFLNDITLIFQENFNPFNYIPLNETMVVTTTIYDSFNKVKKKSQVAASYRAYLGLNYYTGNIQSGQSIYLTKISATEIHARFCNVTGSNADELSMNAILK